MSRRWKWLWAAASVFVALQFVSIGRDNPPVDFDMPSPPAVKTILQRSCYDCHSHETRWPLYGVVAPVSWLFANEVAKARSELNLSTWRAYRPEKRGRLLRDALEEIEQESMPPWEYLLLNPEARLSDKDREILREWILSVVERGLGLRSGK